MTRPFSPSFRDFQKDIERGLRSEGKCETNEHGQTVFHGYQAAVSRMFRAYLEHRAHAPLVAEFRKWNWEWGYNDYLLELTESLQEARDWPLLRELWTAVIAKRRTNYSKTRKARKAVPEKVPEELVVRTRDLLLDSLHQLQDFATALQQEADVREYAELAVALTMAAGRRGQTSD
jgi:hypothetical protein